MSKKMDEEETGKDEQSSGLFTTARKVLLAAVGAAIIAEEEITSFVNRMVERGEIAEKEACQLVKEATERSRAIAQEKAAAKGRRRRRRAVATKAEIEALNSRLNELSERIDEL